MAFVYKKLTAQDKALIPFYAHKQYNFQSASAASNRVTYFSTQYTSESISNYSTHKLSASIDTINTIKYNQIDKLFYRDFKRNIHNKLGPINYLKQPRDLYEKANILSIPSGLFGSEVKPQSFYLSSSGFEVIDDKLGNLIISGTNLDNYPNDIQQNVFRLDPIKGFKKYDLSIYDGYAVYKRVSEDNIIEGKFWRKGLANPDAPDIYTSNQIEYTNIVTKEPYELYKSDEDDSFLFNNIYYNKTTFNTSSLGSNFHRFSKINLDSTVGSYISSPHNKNFNFGPKEDFSISFYITPKLFHSASLDNNRRYIISKSTTKTIIPVNYAPDLPNTELKEVNSEPHFPFEIYMRSSSLYFDRSDGDTRISINGLITGSDGTPFKTSHILCQNTGSTMQMYFDGNLIASSTTPLAKQTKNTANLYIGSKGKTSTDDGTGYIGSSTIGSTFIIGGVSSINRYFNGDISNINIWSRAYPLATITNISESINASPYIGNIFYPNGFATITHPKYFPILDEIGIGRMVIGGGFEIKDSTIKALQFQGSHLIYEHEYQCTIQEHEFNQTTNLSARDINANDPYHLDSFTTSSNFSTYVTTIGLYNEENELLVVGKLGQPIKNSKNTDTTFVLRWDT
jgi:hypothetical protein